jgi:hypothetical protein
MAQTVTIPKPRIEALLKAIEDFEHAMARHNIETSKSVEAFDVYLAMRKPLLEQMFTLKYAIEFGLNPSVAKVGA